VSDLRTLGADVDWPDSAAGTALARVLTAAGGQTAYGNLAALAEWVAAVRPGASQFTRPRLVLSQHPDEDVYALADQLSVTVVVPAVPDADVGEAVAAGGELADAEAEGGTDLLVVADALRGPEPRVLTSVLTGTEPVKVLARGEAATDPETWMALAARVRDQRRDVAGLRDEPDRLLDLVGPPALGFTAGLVLRAATRRTPVLLAGGNTLVAALVAYECHPRAIRWWAVADVPARSPDDPRNGADPVPGLITSRLGLRPVLGMGVGEDAGAVALAGLLAVPGLRAAARIASRFAGTSAP
jgi:nicotinate-nucleotide--dimethylbenzimidazole phosphoribosyltransferase